MSTVVREGRFYDDCSFGCCNGHTTKLELQDTADMFTYYVDGEQKWIMTLSEMEGLYYMLKSMDYL